MRTHTLLTKVASVAVCFGFLLSGPVMAGTNAIIKDVELSADGTLYGKVVSPEGRAFSEAVVQLRYQGNTVAAAKSNQEGLFAISGVRGGAHELAVGTLRSPIRLWTNGTAPNSASPGILISAAETVVRGQDPYCEPGCPPCSGTSGFGLLDVITLATVGTATGALVVGIDNQNKLDDANAQLQAIQDAIDAGAIASP
ncbi:MAG: carboxypeptidase regulatory-like domain-containing protein [Planctomycetaceae bacterium]|nr:carboxypeptidase regulatory-like domain-containing protein [Planctomycetaceae bacterium]